MKTSTSGIAKVCALLGVAAVIFAMEIASAQDTKPATNAAAAPAAKRRVFKDSVTELPPQMGLTTQGLFVQAATAQHKEESMDVLFSLAIPEEARLALEKRVAKGQVISPAELKRDYSAKQADVDALTKWLTAQGYKITKVTPDRTGVYTRATVGDIEKTLEVQMVRVMRSGITYNAARNAPSLPMEVSEGVRAIIGLQPYRHANKQHRIMSPTNGNRAITGKGNGKRQGVQGPATNIANTPPFLVSEILKAYNADNLNVSGAGQTIAILIDTFPADDDLQEFWSRNGLAVNLNQIQKINVKGEQLPPMEGEETLDVEWTSGIAPGATVRVYASGSLQFVDLDGALDAIIADTGNLPGMRQLSISLGLGETFLGGPDGEVATQHQKFLQLAAVGVNVFVSSGDAGSTPDNTGHDPDGPLQAEYEASDPVVIGVGGTSLNLDGTGQVASETAWTFSGGGISIFFDRPVWQVGNGVPPGNKRLVPDVSLAADPNTGALIIFQGQPQQIGGTSWSAPTWAAFCALINENRTKMGMPALPFLNPLIYPLLGTASFRDITSGSNGMNGKYDAGTGYDLVTGIGVPNVKELMKALSQ